MHMEAYKLPRSYEIIHLLIVFSIYPQEPAGAIMSTARDMSKWTKFNLKLGETESGKRLIEKKLMLDMRQLTTPIVERRPMIRPVYPADSIVQGYGYAWFLSEYRGKTMRLSNISCIKAGTSFKQDGLKCNNLLMLVSAI